MPRPKAWKQPSKEVFTKTRDKARNLWWKAIMTITTTRDAEMFDAIMNPHGVGGELLGGRDRWPKRPKQDRPRQLSAPTKRKQLPTPK